MQPHFTQIHPISIFIYFCINIRGPYNVYRYFIDLKDISTIHPWPWYQGICQDNIYYYNMIKLNMDILMQFRYLDTVFGCPSTLESRV